MSFDTTFMEFYRTSHGKMHVGDEDGMLCSVRLNIEPFRMGQTLEDKTLHKAWWQLEWTPCRTCFRRAGVEYVVPFPYWTLT